MLADVGAPLRSKKAASRISLGIDLPLETLELWVNLGDDGLREAAYRGG